MSIQEMKDYIREELVEEHSKMLKAEPNNYSYLFMIANDMGLIDYERSNYNVNE